jgi:mono/diheme cytochrome c family protein
VIIDHTRRRGALFATLILGCVAMTAQSEPDDPVATGRRLYLDGLGHDGKPVIATVQGDVEVTGATVACVGCHKRSGLGVSEGGQRAMAITGPALFEAGAPRSGNLSRTRPAYSEEALARAITEGVAADGQDLKPLMPRFRLDAEDTRALVAYLHTLGSTPEPGVSATELELVTIVSANAPAREREAVTAVLQRFAAIKNGGTRQEQRRAEASRRHQYGEKHVRAFRKWNLSVWTLDGPPAGWPGQLEASYREQPPFAVISGATGSDWSQVHEFCERHALPCILPVTDLPVENGANHYNVYYSAGARLDARVTARSIAEGYGDIDGRILLLYVDDSSGRAAQSAFLDAWPEGRRGNLTMRPVDPAMSPSYKDWKDVIYRERPDILIAWLLPGQLQTLTSIASSATTLPKRIYTAASFTDWQAVRALPLFEQRVLHVYPYSLGAAGLSPFPREEAWLNAQKLSGLERIPAVEALFACHATGEAMAGMADNYSRDYLIETLEHMLDGTGMTTIFPVTTLGTGQRFLAKGAYLVRLAPGQGAARYISAGWVQP